MNEGENNMVKTNELREGDRVKVKLTGEMFDLGMATAAGLKRDEIREATVTDEDPVTGTVELDGVENPFAVGEEKPLVWGRFDPHSGWSVEVVEVDPTNKFRPGDNVTTETGVYGMRGYRGTIQRIEPWGGIFVEVGGYSDMYHYAKELVKIELPEAEPLAEWEKELLRSTEPNYENEPEVEPDDTLEVPEHNGISVGDGAYVISDALYGVDGRVRQILRSPTTGKVFAYIETKDHGTVAVETYEAKRLPTMKEMAESGVTDEIFLGIAREALVASGLAMGLPREQIKTHSESGLIRLQDYLNEGRQTAYNEGYKAGEEYARDTYRDNLEYLTNVITDLFDES